MNPGKKLKKKLPIGTIVMANKDKKVKENDSKMFSATEICRIMKVAKKTGVTTLQVGGLSLTFEKRISTANVSIGSEGKSDLPKVPEVVTSTTDVRDGERALIVQDKRKMEDLRITQMLMDDPVGFEEAEIDAAIHGEMVDADGSRENFEEVY